MSIQENQLAPSDREILPTQAEAFSWWKPQSYSFPGRSEKQTFNRETGLPMGSTTQKVPNMGPSTEGTESITKPFP